MKAEKEFKIIESAMLQALGVGLFKSFDDVALVNNALAEIKKQLQSLPIERNNLSNE